jgi:hypothetical protein
MAARFERDYQDNTIATARTEAETAIANAEARAEAVTTRTLMLEQWTEIFGEAEAQRFMEMSDAVSNWYSRETGENADLFYSRYYAEARRSVEGDVIGDLEQSYNRIEGGKARQMTQEDVENYARMLARSESEARAAIRNEPNKADRVAILYALNEIDPDMAERIATSLLDILRQDEGNTFYRLIETGEK